MELTNETFSEIAGVGVIDPVYELEHERRAHPRVAFGGRARISPLFDTMSNRGVTVMLRDISKSGIGFLSPQRLETSDEFVICLRGKSDKLIKIHCIAQRCEPGGVGLTQFDVGATFELVLETSAMPEETGVLADANASAVAPKEFAAGDSAHSGGPITRFLIRPITRMACGIGSLISTCRNNYRVRRRLKADGQNKTQLEEPNPQVNGSLRAPNLDDETEIDSLLPRPAARSFVPRAGGLFKVNSSSNPQSAVEPEPTPVASEETSAALAAELAPMETLPEVATIAPVVEASIIPATPAAETPAIVDFVDIVDPVQAPIVAAIVQETVPQASAAPVENSPACTTDQMQLEFTWQAQTVADAASAVLKSSPLPTPAAPLPIEIRDVATPVLSAPVVSTPAVEPIQTEAESDSMPCTEHAPLYRTHADVIILLKKRQASWGRHPRRHRQS